MLEEINFNYKITKVDLHDKKEQFNPEFREISPFSKIPVIIDHDNDKKAIFESGAILMYLGERSNKFYHKENRIIIIKPIYMVYLVRLFLKLSLFIHRLLFRHYYNQGFDCNQILNYFLHQQCRD